MKALGRRGHTDDRERVADPVEPDRRDAFRPGTSAGTDPSNAILLNRSAFWPSLLIAEESTSSGSTR